MNRRVVRTVLNAEVAEERRGGANYFFHENTLCVPLRPLRSECALNTFEFLSPKPSRPVIKLFNGKPAVADNLTIRKTRV